MDCAALKAYLNRRVVLDTAGPMVYIGRLDSYDDRGYVLTDADVHDRGEGHSTKEEYINQAHELDQRGTRRRSRRRVFVERTFVISVSALDDVMIDEEADDPEAAQP